MEEEKKAKRSKYLYLAHEDVVIDSKPISRSFYFGKQPFDGLKEFVRDKILPYGGYELDYPNALSYQIWLKDEISSEERGNLRDHYYNGPIFK